MTIFMEGNVAYLQGDLTSSSVGDSIIDPLMGLVRSIKSCGEKFIHIDCGKVRRADISGLQLLYVWMQCARLRGVETRLVNLSYALQLAMKRMNLGHCFTSRSILNWKFR